MSKEKIKVGIVGCGNISGIYLKNCQKLQVLDLVGCADIIKERAAAKAQEYNIKAYTVEEMLADPGIKIVINLTIPKAHAQVALAAIAAGKSVYNEKPLAIERKDGLKMLALAAKKKVLVGGAPDTFMGSGIQTCRKLIDDNVIGETIGATAFMTCHGHESWHPAPEFYYQTGGGPMFDMGPYYLTALVNLMGPVKSVMGATRITFPERTITSQPLNGKKIKVEVPTHIAGLLHFKNNAIGTIITSFDVWAAVLPRIEVYGTKGSISVPDPNMFGGPVRLFLPGNKDWQDVPLTHPFAENSRGVGVADMAYALLNKRPARAGGKLTYHVLDIMHAFHDSARQKKLVKLKSTCPQPAALPMGQGEDVLT